MRPYDVHPTGLGKTVHQALQDDQETRALPAWRDVRVTLGRRGSPAGRGRLAPWGRWGRLDAKAGMACR